MIPARIAAARRFAARLRDCRSGLALTEFAFALPVLLTLGLGGLETAHFAMAHLKVSNIAMLTADGAARVREEIDEAHVIELFTGAKLSGEDMDFAANGRIILSSLENEDGQQWIHWQRCDGALEVEPRYGQPLTEDGVVIDDGTEIFADDRDSESDDPSSHEDSDLDGMGPAGNLITAQPDTAVMVVEVTYDYQPLIPASFLEGRQIRYESSFNVRQRTEQAIQNLNNVTPRSCDTFNA
jgi:hypothetical protein